jgi:hypothetical protein
MNSHLHPGALKDFLGKPIIDFSTETLRSVAVYLDRNMSHPYWANAFYPQGPHNSFISVMAWSLMNHRACISGAGQVCSTCIRTLNKTRSSHRMTGFPMSGIWCRRRIQACPETISPGFIAIPSSVLLADLSKTEWDSRSPSRFSSLFRSKLLDRRSHF